jgi:hypothetical protein
MNLYENANVQTLAAYLTGALVDDADTDATTTPSSEVRQLFQDAHLAASQPDAEFQTRAQLRMYVAQRGIKFAFTQLSRHGARHK